MYKNSTIVAAVAVALLTVATPAQAQIQGMSNGYSSQGDTSNIDVNSIINAATAGQGQSNGSATQGTQGQSTGTNYNSYVTGSQSVVKRALGSTGSSTDTTGASGASAYTTGAGLTTDSDGNVTLMSAQTYTKDIDIAKGDLTLLPGAVVTKSIHLGNGTLHLLSNNTVKGSIAVDAGDIEMGSVTTVSGDVKASGDVTTGSNSHIKGSLTAGGALDVGANAGVTKDVSALSLNMGANAILSGKVGVTGSSTAITIGSNAKINSTLTSAAGLTIGANSKVKLFLSGKQIQINTKVYNLGGKIIRKGANTTVGLPSIPKIKKTDVVKYL